QEERNAERLEEVELLRAPRRVGGARKPMLLDERIDKARFSNVGAPSEGHLVSIRGGKELQVGHTLEELPRPVEQRLASDQLAERAAPVAALLPSLPSTRPSALPTDGGSLLEALAMCPFSLLPMSRPFAASSRVFHLSTPRFFQR